LNFTQFIRSESTVFSDLKKSKVIPVNVITGMKPTFIKERMVVNGRVYFPRKKRTTGLAAHPSPEEIDPKVLPVGRVSVDTVGFGELLRDLISEMRSVGAAYPLEYLEAMQNLSLVNPDVAQMIDNIVQLGNTGHKVMVESDSEQVRDAAIEELNRFNMTVFGRFGGIDGFVNSALAQIGRGGAISIEWVVSEDLTGIDKMVFVPLKEIRFLYDPASGEYAPHQKTCDLTQGDQGLIALNTATYQYCAMQTLDNSPYAVPPILSALESITIQRDIVKNLRFIAKKMGILGFVNFLIRAPKQSPGEKTEEYIARCQQFLDQQAQHLKHNYRDGIAVGLMDSFTVEHHSITGDAAGAKDLFEMNEQQVFSGLKADPALHGRTYSTTETYAGVVYEKMLSIITNYQRTVRSVLEYGYKLHLSLRGIDYQSLWIEFEPSKSLSAQRDETTYATRLANLKILHDQGIIDQNQFAQEAGYDRPAEEGPLREMLQEPGKVQKALDNLVEYIVQGNASESVSVSIARHEQRKKMLEAQLQNLKAREPNTPLLTPYAVKPMLINLDEILTKDVVQANAYFKGLFPEQVKMTAKKEGRSVFYEAAGRVNLTRLMRFATPINGAPNWTILELLAPR